MPNKSSLDRTALVKMFAATQREILAHPMIFHELTLESIKAAIVSNIQPLSFRKIVEDRHHYYMSPLMDIETAERVILKDFDAEALYIDCAKSHGVAALSHAGTITPSNSIADKRCDMFQV